MARTINQKLQHKFVTMTANMERLSESEVITVTGVLKGLEVDLSDQLFDNPALTNYARSRYEALIDQGIASIESTYKNISGRHHTFLVEVGNLSQAGTSRAFESVGVPINSVALNHNQLKSLASDALIEGAPSKAWWSLQDQDLQHKFMQQMRMGYAAGETVDQLIQRIRGTATGVKIPYELDGEIRYMNEFKGGIMSISTRNAAALVRTSVQQIASDAKLAMFRENKDLLLGIAWMATLDFRTTLLCASRDGLLYDVMTLQPIGHTLSALGGIPAHWQCRSTWVPVLKSFKELLQDEKVSSILDNITNTSTRASLDGQLPQSTSFNDWFSNLSETDQIAFLGKGRYAIWKTNGLSMADLVNQYGNPLTIQQLADLYGVPTITAVSKATAIAAKAIDSALFSSYTTAASKNMAPAPIQNVRELTKILPDFIEGYMTNTGGHSTVLVQSLRKRGVMMSTNPSNGIIKLHNGTMQTNWGKYNPATNLYQAWNRMAMGRSLNLAQEYAVESLWHEILHNTQVFFNKSGKYISKTSRETKFSELLVQWTARRTYGEFMNGLGTRTLPTNMAEIKASGLGYRSMISQFDNIVLELAIDETVLLREFTKILRTVEVNKYEDALCDVLVSLSPQKIKSSKVRAMLRSWTFSSAGSYGRLGR